MNLPSAIRRHRDSKLMTQDEYAAFLGVSQSTLWLWENGRRQPSRSMARLLIDKGVNRVAVMDAVANGVTGRAA